jgi:hypothetical protein
MRAAFVRTLIVSTLVLPMQPALAGTGTPSADVQSVLAIAQLDIHEQIAVEGINITLHLAGGDHLFENALVTAGGASTKCTTVTVTGCPTPTQAVLSDCADARTYTLAPGGAGVGTFSNGGTIDGTVSHGSISLACQTFPAPPPARR